MTRAEEAEAKNKKLEQEIYTRDQEITSLQHKLSVLDESLEKAEAKLADAKAATEEGETSKMTAENLTRKIQLLEEELDTAEKNVKETVEKYVLSNSQLLSRYIWGTPGLHSFSSRLRQVDVKAEHFERQVQRVEAERDSWEKKYEVRFWFFPLIITITNILSLYRKPRRNTSNPRGTWTNWSSPWKAFDPVTPNLTLDALLPLLLTFTNHFSYLDPLLVAILH